MKTLLTILGCFLFIPVASADVTLTSDVSSHYLEIQTGSTLTTDGFDVTVGGGTGNTLIYGFLNANAVNNDSTLFTQKARGFVTSGAGDVLFGGTGTLLLTDTGAYIKESPLTVSGSLKNLTLDNGLVGYWKFDEGTGLVAADSSRHGNNGTLTNYTAAQLLTGWVVPSHAGSFFNPRALEFDGVDDYVNAGNAASLDITGDQTAGAWIYKKDNRDSRIIVKNGAWYI